MTRHRDDHFPKQGRYLGATDPADHDPITIAISQRQAKEAEIREAVANGHTPQADPQELRGIPVQAKGVGGTSPGTNPLSEAIRNDHRLAAA